MWHRASPLVQHNGAIPFIASRLQVRALFPDSEIQKAKPCIECERINRPLAIEIVLRIFEAWLYQECPRIPYPIVGPPPKQRYRQNLVSSLRTDPDKRHQKLQPLPCFLTETPFFYSVDSLNELLDRKDTSSKYRRP